MSKSVEISLGPLRVDLNEERTLIFRRGAPGGLHLTAFHDARRVKRGEKFFTPHLTIGRRQIGWFEFSERAAQEFTDRLTTPLFAKWVAASRPVDLDTLHKQGWLVAVANEQLMERWVARCHVEGNRYRFPTDAEWDEFGDDMVGQLITPRELKGREASKSALTAVRAKQAGTPESIFLSYYPDAWAAGPAGWYATPIDWLPARVFFATFIGAASPRLRSGLRTICGRLGLGNLSEALAP